MPHASSSSQIVLTDLQAIFGQRLEALVTYAPERSPQPSLAVVASLTFDDLAACARHARPWLRAGFVTPVILTRAEFARSLDAFPVEFGEIIASHSTVFGENPFTGLTVAPADLRRACETQVRSLLLHLREDYMEAGADPRAIRALVIDSAPEFRSLLSLLARLDGERVTEDQLADWAARRLGLDHTTVTDLVRVAAKPVRGFDGSKAFPAYLAATELLARRIDEWT